MIEIMHYAIGFIVYLFFNIITFRVYSKKEETTNKAILFFIYVYYTILSGYIIYLVDYDPILKNNFEIIMQTLFMIIAGGLFMTHYYISNIKPLDEKYDTQFSRF